MNNKSNFKVDNKQKVYYNDFVNLKFTKKDKEVQMLLTKETKRALKRIKGEQNLNYKELANLVGIHSNTIRKIIKNSEAEEVRPRTFIAISQFISANY